MEIRLRAAVLVINDEKILLVPHYQTDRGAVQWVVPGGSVDFGEPIQSAAIREFQEETGLLVDITGLFDVSEVILAERPYHSVTVTYLGRIVGGEICAEAGHPFGEKVPRWFAADELSGVEYHPKQVIEKAIDNG